MELLEEIQEEGTQRKAEFVLPGPRHYMLFKRGLVLVAASLYLFRLVAGIETCEVARIVVESGNADVLSRYGIVS